MVAVVAAAAAAALPSSAYRLFLFSGERGKGTLLRRRLRPALTLGTHPLLAARVPNLPLPKAIESNRRLHY